MFQKFFFVASAVLFLTIGNNQAIPQEVQCTFTPAEPNACYILTPIYLKPAETLAFANASNLGEVTHFELKAYTNLVNIPLSLWTTFPKLEELILAEYSSISTVATTDFIYATELRVVNLKGNKITTIPYMTFALASKLQAIDLSFNGITEIEDLAFNNLGSLEYLDLSYNRLSLLKHFSLAGATNLRVLDLSHNKIKSIEDAALNFPKLAVVNFNTNDVKLLPDNLFGVAPIQTAPLQYVDFGENKLTHIGQSFYGLNELNVLNLTSNKKIDDLNLPALAALPKLETLLLSSTGIVFPGMTLSSFYTAAPASNSPVKQLYLAKNKLANPDILKQLAYFRQLEVLSLEENRFTFIDDINSLRTWFPKLHTIFIGENKLNCEWLNASIPIFQEANVNVYTIKKTKTWVSSTVYEQKLIDMEDCFDVEKLFTNIFGWITKFGGKPTV